MPAILLADTDPEIKGIVHEVENMCHAAGLPVIIHYEGGELDDVLDLVDSKIIVFSPKGKLTLDEMFDKYGRDVLLVVGGFTEERDFKSGVYKYADDMVSLGPEFLPIPKVIKMIIEAYGKKAKQPLEASRGKLSEGEGIKQCNEKETKT